MIQLRSTCGYRTTILLDGMKIIQEMVRKKRGYVESVSTFFLTVRDKISEKDGTTIVRSDPVIL